MPRFDIEVLDVSVKRWCYFGFVQAVDEEQAISLGWKRVEELDIDSKSTLKDLRVNEKPHSGETKQNTICPDEGRCFY